jgi:hypothetical protein
VAVAPPRAQVVCVEGKHGPASRRVPLCPDPAKLFTYHLHNTKWITVIRKGTGPTERLVLFQHH